MEELVIIDRRNIYNYADYIPSRLLSLTNDNSITMMGINYFNNPVGGVVYRFVGGRCQLIHIYVAKQYRDRGLATFAMEQIFDAAVQKKCVLFETTITPGRHMKFEELLDSMSAIRTDEKTAYMYCKLGELKKLIAPKDRSEKVVSLMHISAQNLNMYLEQLTHAGYDNVLKQINKSDYVQKGSCGYVENDRLTGLLLIENDTETITASWFIDTSENEEAGMEMLKFAYNALMKHLDDDTECRLAVINEKMEDELKQNLAFPIIRRQKVIVDISSLYGR